MTPQPPERVRRAVSQRLSLRAPQQESLKRLDGALAAMDGKASLADRLAAVRALFPEVQDFERAFPSLCFALATGVGKTRLMGAFIAFLYLTAKSRNFFVLAPNTTIYEKLVADLGKPESAKYVFRGIAEFGQRPPIIVTGDNWQEGRGVRGGDLFGGEVVINIFNVDKINKEAGKIRSFRETLGTSYYDYLAGLEDLVMLMDEAHRYRAKAAAQAIFDLKPQLGLELTATPKSTGAGGKPFRNVIHRYALGNAMADGFVKEPAVATRKDFRPADYTRDQLEAIMLEDGVHYHEHVKAEAELYARQTGRKRVHPFMLVVAQDTTHASQLKAKIDSDDFFGGRYRGRAIEVHSKTSGEESDEAAERLLALESNDQTDIVIHVNKLKEGWDVTNLYTIVPLRASASDILTEQTLGRGLRLPYGERTGVAVMDTLTVIAHDRFDQVVKEARADGSIVKEMREVLIGDGGTVPLEKPQVVDVPSRTEEALGIAPLPPGVAEPPASEWRVSGPAERDVAKIVLEVIEKRFAPRMDSARDLLGPELQAEITKAVEAYRPQQASPQGEIVLEPVNTAAIVQKVAAVVARESIAIPEIVVLPSREVNFWFEDFDLTGISHIRHQPLSDEIDIRNLRTESQIALARPQTAAREERVENYIVRHLIDRPEVDYDAHADLLFKLAGQMVAHLGGYLPDADAIENVALTRGKQLADVIFEQMRQHLRRTPVDYQTRVVRSFRMLKAMPVTMTADRANPLTRPADPLSATPSYVFNDLKKCPYPQTKFSSDPERRLAALMDSDREPNVMRWLKPGRGQFEIEYEPGRRYEPDFVVETTDGMFIIEVKAANQLEDNTVKAKARATQRWVELANEFTEKKWRYAIIPDSDIRESSTFAGLLASATA